MENLNKRQRQSLDTKRKIEEAADICFMRKGMAYTLITDICAQAGISVGTFYHYFKNKNELIVSQFTPFDFYFTEKAEELLEENVDTLSQLIRFSHAFSRDAYKTGDNELVIEYLKARASITIEELLPRNRPYFLVLCTIIARGQAGRHLRTDMSPVDMADMVMIVTRGYNLDWANNNGGYDLKKKLDCHLKVLYEGLQWQEDRQGSYRGQGDCLPEQLVPASYAEQVRQLRSRCEELLKQQQTI